MVQTGKSPSFLRISRSILALEHAGGSQNAYESINAFSETDFSEDLKKFEVPTLVFMTRMTNLSLKDSEKIGKINRRCESDLVSWRPSWPYCPASGSTKQLPVVLLDILGMVSFFSHISMIIWLITNIRQYSQRRENNFGLLVINSEQLLSY